MVPWQPQRPASSNKLRIFTDKTRQGNARALYFPTCFAVYRGFTAFEIHTIFCSTLLCPCCWGKGGLARGRSLKRESERSGLFVLYDAKRRREENGALCQNEGDISEYILVSKCLREERDSLHTQFLPMESGTDGLRTQQA